MYTLNTLQIHSRSLKAQDEVQRQLWTFKGNF